MDQQSHMARLMQGCGNALYEKLFTQGFNLDVQSFTTDERFVSSPWMPLAWPFKTVLPLIGPLLALSVQQTLSVIKDTVLALAPLLLFTGFLLERSGLMARMFSSKKWL